MAPIDSRRPLPPAPAAPAKGTDGWASGPLSPQPPQNVVPVDPGASVKDLLVAAEADGTITQAEWSAIRPVADAAPHVASADARLVLDAWASDGFQLDSTVRSGMRDYLQSTGYNVPSSKPANVPAAQLVEDILATNVGEEDRDFTQLAALAGRSAQQTTVAVLDGGIDVAHQELQQKEWTNAGEIAGDGIDNDQDGLVDDVHGWDFADHDANVKDIDHGTHVTGIATRGTDNIQSISCRVFGSSLDPKEVADAIDYAAAHGAKVMNMSFKISTPEEVRIISEAIKRHPEVLFCKSAGNDGKQIDGGSYKPESYLPYNLIDNLAVVSAAEPNGDLADYSNYGAPYSTHAIQGSGVFSSVNNGHYQSMDGTSMASPNLMNVAAKLLNLDPQMDPVTLKAVLADTTTVRPDWQGKTASGGLINEHDALRVAGLTGLVRSGKTLAQAADQLQLAGPERERLTAIAAKYAPTPRVQTPPDGRAWTSAKLDDIRARVANGEKVRVVFDIDDTLADNRGRTMAVAKAYDEANGTHLFDALSLDQVGKDGYSTARALGLSKDECKAFSKFWNAKFFEPEMNQYDLPMTEMIDLAKAAKDAGAEVDYLTGRTEDGRPGTLSELQRLGLPDADTDHLTMKRDLSVPTGPYKAEKFAEWVKQADVGIGFFITESHRDINAIQAADPTVPCVLLDSGKERNEPPVAEGTPVWPTITNLTAQRAQWSPWETSAG